VLDVNPARHVKRFKVNDRRLRYLETTELAALLEAARQDTAAAWLVPAITLAVHKGLRQGELLRLRWADLSPTLALATVTITKNNDAKHVPLNADTQAVLAALPRSGATVLAWPWGDPISHVTLHYAFHRACKAAGITDFRWHDLRHTFASHLVMAGVDLHTVGELLGHRDPKMTMRYAHLSPAHKVAAVEKLRAALATPAAEPVQAAVNAPSPPPLTRFEHAPSGRQTAAKRKYVEARRVGEWRRGESNRAGGEGAGQRSRLSGHLCAENLPLATLLYRRIVPEGQCRMAFVARTGATACANSSGPRPATASGPK
jgi:hypothetical protein